MSRQLQILRTRAEKLAKAIKVKEATHDFIEVLVFKLSHERYAIELKYVKEVYPYKDYTPLSNVPSFIFGIVNIRRKILSIFDLKFFFNLPVEEAKDKKLIILENSEMEFALLTDGIEGIQKIPFHAIQSSLSLLSGAKVDFLKGVTAEKIILINAEKLLSSKQIIVNETVDN